MTQLEKTTQHSAVSVHVSCLLSLCQAQSCFGGSGGAQSQHLSVSLVVRILCQRGCCTEWRGLGQGSPAGALGILREIPC